jgi:hypothetical protein
MSLCKKWLKGRTPINLQEITHKLIDSLISEILPFDISFNE